MGDSIELGKIVQAIWRKLWLIFLVTVLATVGTFAVGANMQPIYRAKVTMKVDQPASAPLSYRSITTGENLALTYSKLLKTRPLLGIVIANLGLGTSPDALSGNIDTNLIPETQLLELMVRDTDAQRAANIANEVAFTFISLHNQEKQLKSLTTFEQDVLAQIEDLKGLIERNRSVINESSVSKVPGQEGSGSSLQASLVAQQSTYAGLLSTYLDIQLAQSQFFDVTVIEPAVPPTRPIRPQVFLYTLVGAFLGGNLSLGLVFLLQYLDRSVKTRDDVAQFLSLPCLGVIPRMQGTEHSAGPIASALPHSPVSEAFRALRTNIRFASVDKPLSTILVASPEPEAGKTTVAVNLGVVLAQAGFRVVLIDTDLRLPRLHEAFGIDNVAGLTDLLVGDTKDVENHLQETEIENLRVLASGVVPPNPSELLGSKRMEAVLAKVGEYADFIILDTSPLLPVTDAAVLAPKVDGILLVVRASKTRRDVGQEAAQGLVQVGGSVIGVVLNDAAAPGRRDYRYLYGRGDKADGNWWSRRWKTLLARAQSPLKRIREHAKARSGTPSPPLTELERQDG